MKTKVTPVEALKQRSLAERETHLKKYRCCSIQASSLAMVLAVSLFVILLSIVWSVLFFSSVTVLAESLRSTTLSRLVDRVTISLHELTTFVDVSATLIEEGHLDFFSDFYATRESARNIMLMHKRRNELISSIIFYRSADNQFLSCVFQPQLGDKYQEGYKTHFTGNSSTRQVIFDDDTFSTVSSNLTTSLNPKNLLGIVTAQKEENIAKKFVWSPPHMFASGVIVAPQIVLARALTDPATRVVSSLYGLVYTVLRPLIFSRYLAEIVKSSGYGLAYVVDAKTGYLLATSDPSIPTYNKTVTGGYRLLSAYESENRAIAESSSFLNMTLGHFSSMPAKLQTQFSAVEGTIFLDLIRYNTSSNLDIVFVLLVNQNDLIGDQIAVLIVACLASAFFIAITFVTGCAGSQIILRPLRTLRVQMKEAEEMNLDNIDTSYLSYFSEIKSLQHVFYIMVERLVEYRRFLPPHILEALDNNAELDPLESSTSFRKKHEKARPSIVSAVSSGKTSIRHENKFSIGLDTTELVILSLKVCELQSKTLESMPMDDYVHAFKIIMDKADTLCRVNRGSLIHFSEDSITLAWPCSRPNSIERAASVCFSLHRHVVELNQRHERDSLTKLSVVFSINSGRCYQGNIGGQSGPRMHKTFGGAVSKAEALVQLAASWKVHILVSSSVAEALSKLYASRPIDILTTIPQAHGSKHIVKLSPSYSNSEIVYELLGSLAVSHDEWMYEMNAKAEIEKHSAVSNALTSLFTRVLTSEQISSEATPFFAERQALETHAKEFPDQLQMVSHYLTFLNSLSKANNMEGYPISLFSKTRSIIEHRSLVLGETVHVS